MKLVVAIAMVASLGTAVAEHGSTEAWQAAEKARVKKFEGKVLNARLPVRWSEDGTELFYHLEMESGGRKWHARNLRNGEVRELTEKPEGKESPKLKSAAGFPKPTKPVAKSPDKKREIILREGKLLLKQGEKSTEITAMLEEGWAWENRVLWSPDSSRFIVWKNTQHPIHEVHYVRSAPEDQVQPQHFVKRYSKPGDELNIAHPVIFFLDGREPIEIDPSLIANPFSIRNPAWQPDGKRFTFEYIERGFGKFRLIEIDTESGEQRALIDERDEKFIHVFGNTFRRDLKEGDEIIWLSERDGWNHLYLINGRDGSVIRQLTKGDWLVREVVAVDEENRSMVVAIGGYYPEQDPYQLQFARVNLDDGSMKLLTDGDGTHELIWSPDQKYFVAKWSRVDHPPVHELRSASGEEIATLAEGKLGNLNAAGWQMPERFVAKDRNNQHDIHGVIFRPDDFDPSKKYPVIEAIYAGPHGSFTPRSWRINHGVMSEMANAGFIVVKLDGLGTNHRGKAFQQVAYKNLIDSGFPDRIKWMKAAAKKEPAMDLARVGIYGGSAGGQSTLAGLLTHPEFYKAGAADCGCHDNRMDKIWWNEQWMDWPVDESYAANSNVTHAAQLEGKLMLTVGEVDTNVDPASTIQVVNALIKADKDFEFYLVPNAGHGVGEKPYLRRKRIEFFQRHLGNPTK